MNSQPVADQTEDEQLIYELLARLSDMWARGDGDAYADCFTEDCTYITFNGIHLRGRSENADLHRALFRSVLRGSQLAADIEKVEFLAPGVAIAHTIGHGRKKSHQTYVLTKLDAHWLIKSFQNTRVQPLSAWMTRLMQRRGSQVR